MEFDFTQHNSNKAIDAVYSHDAHITLWNILFPLYDKGNSYLRCQATSWHHGLRTEIKEFIESNHIYSPTRIISPTVGMQMLGKYGNLEYSILCDRRGSRSILVRQFYFNANFLPQTNAHTATMPSVKLRYRFYSDGRGGTSVVVRNIGGKKRFNFIDEDGNLLFDRDFKQVKQFNNGLAYGYGFDRRYYQLRINGSYIEYSTESVRHITQSQLCRIVESAVREILNKQMLNESYITRRKGKYTIVYGDNQPHSIEGLEKYGNNLYDVAMYNSKDEHICAFSIGQDSNKFICCNLEYDKDYGEWLGFTPIKYYNVPTLIRQDLRERFTNS